MLPPLCSQADCVVFAKGAGLAISSNPYDISDNASKTWYISVFLFKYLKIINILNKSRDFSWSLILSWTPRAFAVAQGRDSLTILRDFRAIRRVVSGLTSGLSFIRALRAIRRGFANGNLRYVVIPFQKI
jgi:hypothetical protein